MSLEDDILIERFLKGELSKEEIDNFYKKIEENKRFKVSYLLEKKLFENLNEKKWSFVANESTDEIKDYDELFKDEVSQNLKIELEKGALKYKAKRRKNTFKWILSIASIILLALTINFFFTKKTIHVDEIYSEYVYAKKMPSFRSRGEIKVNEKLIQAERLFIDKEYKKAIHLFKNGLEKDQNNGIIYIYMGLSYIELQDFDNAENILNKLLESNSIDAEKALWYKSLLYVKTNEIEKSKVLLNKIIKKSSYKKREAKELLSKLEDL